MDWSRTLHRTVNNAHNMRVRDRDGRADNGIQPGELTTDKNATNFINIRPPTGDPGQVFNTLGDKFMIGDATNDAVSYKTGVSQV